MPDLSNRDDWEKKLADELEKELQRFARLLGKLIPGIESALMGVPEEVWNQHGSNLNGVVAPIVHDIFMARSGEIIESLGFTSVDWGLVDTAAADWARQYSAQLITGMTNTSRERIQQIIPQYFEQGWTQGQLTEQIMSANGAFSRTRAEMIARTEVTQAASEGAQQTARELEKQGITMVPVWRTRNDEVVCPICGPRNGLVIQPDNETMGQFPAAHPRCRCWVTHEIPRTE